jgi:hypothetical protein
MVALLSLLITALEEQMSLEIVTVSSMVANDALITATLEWV